MNISYNWLKRYIDLHDDAETVAKILTSIGLEVGTVEKVQTIKGGLEGLVVGEVLTCVEHPNSDHLHITTTRVAPDAEPLQIVCGAPNVAAGQKVIVATVGTVLYDGDEKFTIKRGKIRGEESLGMLCAEDEIGVGSSHDGIIVLPAETPVGMPAREYYHVEDDTLIEVDITPNRSDAASHYGVARDLHAYYVAQMGEEAPALVKPSVEAFKVDNHDLEIKVRVENEDACPRYTGVSISNVEVKESPDWLKKSLTTIGLRPINNIVDVTNFVLHECGQALHAFDADKIKGHQIIVKNARQGEKFVTLDGQEREMDERDLMICNAEEPMCIAGVFGGLDSGVTNETKNVFLESAYFEPVSIRKTSRRHQLQTDASFRYERGCDPNNTMYVLRRAALLIQEVAGGQVSMEVSDNGKKAFEPWPVELNIPRVNSLIGKEIGEDTIARILGALECEIVSKEADVWHITVPRYRVDVQRECDVVEDVLRLYGYDNVEFPEKLNASLSYGQKPDPQKLQTRISEQLTAQGFYEIMNNSLTKVAYYEDCLDSCVKIMNPLSQDLGVLRQSMLFGGLESIQRNVNRKQSDLKFYEFGSCYHYDANKQLSDWQRSQLDENDHLHRYSEEKHLALWVTGKKTAQSWVMPQQDTTFYTLRAYVDMVLRRLGVAYSDKYVSMQIVPREILKKFDIDQPVYYADIRWNDVLKQSKKYKVQINDLPKFPEVKRDFALLVDKQTEFAELARTAFETEKKLLKNVFLFDVYEGKNLPEGKKSYALSFILQDNENTLKDTQIEKIMERLKAAFEERFGAQLR